MAKKPVKLTDEYIENINDYSKEIVTIEDFMAAVRMTIGQYLGYDDYRGWLNAIRELFQNGLDEQADPKSPCNITYVRFTEATQQIEVEDNGRGIPFDDQARVFCDPHTSKNYRKELYQYSAGRHGIGAKATNAASSRFIVTSYILGKEKTSEFENGIPIKEGKVIKSKSGKQGTYVAAWPHPILKNPDLKAQDILDLVELLVPLAKIGTEVVFEGICKDGKMLKQTVINQDGLLTYLVKKTTNPLFKPIVMVGDTGKMRAEIAFTYDASSLSGDADIISFANYCPTLSGTHVDGFITAVTTYFRDYMNKIYLKNTNATQKKGKKKKNELKVIANDIKVGLKAVVHGLHLYPTFGGQAKESMTNEDIKLYFMKEIPVWLDQWTKDNPKDFAKLCGFIKMIADERQNSDERKMKITSRYESSGLTGLPAKYLKPNGSEHLELIIVEGDSALGSYKNSRNSARQGLFPIRGKIINAMDKSLKDVLENVEVQAITSIIGGGFGKSFDITKVKWEKIIIATDADMDGYHIRTLLMKFFLKYMPDMILQGRIYIAIPPLFGLKIGKDKMRYFTDKYDYIKYVEHSFSKENKLQYPNGSMITDIDATRILYENSNYVTELEKLTFAIDPYLLETVLLHRNDPINKMKKAIIARHRFMDSVVVAGDTIVITGIEKQKSQTIFLNSKFLDRCAKVIPIIDKSFATFILNDKEVTLYGLMKTFSDFQPNNINRYKGLGEMNEDQLAESTLYPSPTRKLMQYTVDNLAKDLEKIRYLECNRQELLKTVIMK